MSLYKAIHPVRFRNQRYESGDLFHAPRGRVAGLVKRGVIEPVDLAKVRQEPPRPIEKAVKNGGQSDVDYRID